MNMRWSGTQMTGFVAVTLAGLAQQSVGAGMQNLMLAAHALGLASYWISAPLFAPEAVREALGLPGDYVAQAFVVLGYAAAAPRPRPPLDASSLIIER